MYDVVQKKNKKDICQGKKTEIESFTGERELHKSEMFEWGKGFKIKIKIR